jgi:hypothetical protein
MPCSPAWRRSEQHEADRGPLGKIFLFVGRGDFRLNFAIAGKASQAGKLCQESLRTTGKVSRFGHIFIVRLA